MFGHPSNWFSQIKTFNRSARLFLFAMALDGLLMSGWQLFFNLYILEAGYSRDFLGLLTSLRSVSALLFGIPIGMLTDRIGRRRALILGIVLATITMVGMVTVREQNWMLVLAFLTGIGESFWVLSQAPLMMQVSDEKNRTLLFSLQAGLITLSSALGNLLAGALPGLFGAWLGVPQKSAAAYQAVVVASVLAGALTLIPFFLMTEPPRKRPVTSWNWRSLPVARVLSRPLTLQLATPNLLIGLGAALLIPYLNVFYVDRFQVSDQTLGSVFSLLAIMTGVGTLFSPRLARGLGTKIRAVVAVQGISVLFLALIGLAPMLWMSVIGFLMRGMLMNMAAPLWSAFSMEQTPEHEHGTVNSIQNIAWSLGWAIGPFLSGIVQERYGFTPLFITTSILYALAIGLTWLMFRGHEQALQTSRLPEAV